MTKTHSISRLGESETAAMGRGDAGAPKIFLPEYGNSYAVFHPTPEQAAAGYDIALRFEVTRREYARDLKATNTKTPKATEATMRRYLEPDKMAPLNATIAELARAQTAGAKEP